ncbi:MAG: hypothetical protein KAU94_03535 [Verrucomicrobia bacterium]|nr:hypothetical protein [Verrucomicrobiota bacterium]
MIKRVLGLVFLFSAALFAAPSAEQLRAATLEHIRAETQQKGMIQFTTHLSRRLDAVSRVPTRELVQMAVLAECVRFMQLSQEAKPTDATAAWILASGSRLHRLIDTLAPEDSFGRGLAIIDQLRAHDPAGCDEYFDLILAIAIVLDHSEKVRIHGQMGRKTLLGDNDAVKRYDYFKALYAGGDAKIDYEKLGAAELRFVVHVPVPISELEWARENVRGSLSGWGDTYSSIEYDHDRLQSSRYAWDTGPYTLAEIQEKGGICVDQAYYAVLTARAHGIPAIYFHGSGKSANHAWFAFMKSPGDWLLDIGRYQGDEYTTGYAIDPQTRLTMTDHDVEYACERSLHSDAFTQASAYTSIAEVLLESDPENALRCARLARQQVKRHLRPWMIEQQLLADRKDYDALVELFADKKDIFRKYPDILTQTAKEIEAVLRKGGRNDAADRLMRSLNAGVDDDRDDLKRSFESERINRIIATGDMKKARKELEQLLDEQKDGGNKVFPLIRGYIKLTKKSGQTREAAKFMEGYIEDLIDENSFSPGYEQNLLRLLHAVYTNDGDTKDAAKVAKRIERLNY